MKKNNILGCEDFRNIYIEKCHTYQDCLDKLNELFITSGIDIRYDKEKGEAYLITEASEIPMMKHYGALPEAYSVEVDNKLIGFYFKLFGGMFGFGVEMEVIVKEDNNFQSYAFKQSYFEDGAPWFYYDEFINGESKSFSSNGHVAHFNTSNVPSRSALATINRWGDDIKVGRFTRIKGNSLAFGGICRHTGDYKKGNEVYIYVPTVHSESIKNNKSEERLMFVDTIGPAQICETRRKYYYTGNADDGTYFPYYDNKSKDLEPFAKLKVFEIDDPEILNYCIDVLQRFENIIFYDDMKEYLLNQPVGKYISKYFMHLLNGIEYYQNLNRKDLNVIPSDLGKVLRLNDNILK